MKMPVHYYRPLIYWVVIGTIGFLFSANGLDKLLNREMFQFQLSLSPLSVMRHLAPFLSWIIPIAHLLAVAALFADRFRTGALYAFITLRTLYSLYIGGLLISGYPLPCTCAGIKAGISWSGQLGINILLLLLLTITVRLGRKNEHQKKNFAYA